LSRSLRDPVGMDRALEAQDSHSGFAEMNLPRMIERMHRRYLDILQTEMKRVGVRGLTPVQAFMLLDMGNDELTTQELVDRGYYVRTNALYTIRKLVEAGYFLQTRDPHDRRAMRISTTPKARAICEKLRARLAELDRRIEEKPTISMDYVAVHDALRRLERAWDDYLRYGVV